jgi:hypothetical protein
MLEKSVKLSLAILFFLCLAKMPYGYYEFIRFTALIAFVYLAYKNYAEGNKLMAFIYAALAILFQPLFKIYLGRELWNIVDVIVGVFLIGLVFYQPKKKADS